MSAPGPGRGPWRWTRAVSDAKGLSKRERAVAHALVKFVDWETGQCNPSVAKLAESSGWSERSIQRGINELVALGIVTIQGSRCGGRPGRLDSTTRYELNLAALQARGDRRAPVTGDSGSPDGCQAVAGGVTAGHRTGDTVTPKPSIHPYGEPIKEPSIEPGPGSAPVANGCMADPKPEPSRGKTLRDALSEAGIKGANLDRLANSALTPDEVRRELASIADDPKVRNRPAVLATRLATLAGVALSDRPKLDAKTSKALGSIEQMRRNLHSGK